MIKDMDQISLIYFSSMTIINIVSMILNGLLLVMFVVYHKELLTNMHNKILMAMLLASFFIGVTGTMNWLLLALEAGKDAYKFIGMIPMFSFFIASIATLCILTFDQLIAVKCPLRYPAIVTPWRIHFAIVSVFAFVVAFVFIQISIYKVKGSEEELKVRGLVVTVVFILGMLTLVITNFQLYKAIQYQRKRLRPLSDNTNVHGGTEAESYIVQRRQSSFAERPIRPSRRFKTGKTCIVLVVMYIVIWLPLVIYRITAVTGRDNAIPLFLRISMILATLYQIVMPCFYLLKKRDFREKLTNLICRSSSST